VPLVPLVEELETELDPAVVPAPEVVAALAVMVPASAAPPIAPAAMSPATPPQRTTLLRVFVLVTADLLRHGHPGGALRK
jgi:hypothetical protein